MYILYMDTTFKWIPATFWSCYRVAFGTSKNVSGLVILARVPRAELNGGRSSD